MIEVKVKRGLSSEVAEKLHKHLNVLKVYEITGETDAVIEACFRDINELNIFLKEIRRACPEIADTVIHIVLDERKTPMGGGVRQNPTEGPDTLNQSAIMKLLLVVIWSLKCLRLVRNLNWVLNRC